MDRTERFMQIDRLLQTRKATPLALMMEVLEVSRATIKRDLEYMRDRMQAPIVWDRELRGYRYEQTHSDEPRFTLPGLWFNASEIHALLTMDQLLGNLQPGLLGPHIEPLKRRIRSLLEKGDHSAEEIASRIVISQLAERPVDPAIFEVVSSALLQRRRVLLHHYHRGRDNRLERVVSPQRLVYYRDNWYLVAWCHLREDLRNFGMDAIEAAEALEQPARDLPAGELDALFGAGYGIFSGRAVHEAVLRFTAERARWVSREIWHPDQHGHFDSDGRYVLTLPYTSDTELVLDILRYGPDVEVLAPASLREKTKARLEEALRQYPGE